MELEQSVSSILDYAKEQGLTDVEIRIGDNGTNYQVTLWVQGKDRVAHTSLLGLEASLKEHENLDWMKWGGP